MKEEYDEIDENPEMMLTRLFADVMDLQSLGKAEIYVAEDVDANSPVSVDIPNCKSAVVIVLANVKYDTDTGFSNA